MSFEYLPPGRFTCSEVCASQGIKSVQINRPEWSVVFVLFALIPFSIQMNGPLLAFLPPYGRVRWTGLPFSLERDEETRSNILMLCSICSDLVCTDWPRAHFVRCSIKVLLCTSWCTCVHTQKDTLMEICRRLRPVIISQILWSVTGSCAKITNSMLPYSSPLLRAPYRFPCLLSIYCARRYQGSTIYIHS